MFQNYQQKPEGNTSQPGAPTLTGQQISATGLALQGSGAQNASTSQQQMLQQALQQNPELAAQLSQRLQPVQVSQPPVLITLSRPATSHNVSSHSQHLLLHAMPLLLLCLCLNSARQSAVA